MLISVRSIEFVLDTALQAKLRIITDQNKRIAYGEFPTLFAYAEIENFNLVLLQLVKV